MSRTGWGQGPIDIGPDGIKMPPFTLPSLGRVKLVGGVLAVAILLLTGYYQVEPDEVGVVQRFGAFDRTTESGPHLKIPFGVETVTKVPVQRQLKMEFGFRTLRAAAKSEFAPTTPETLGESVMLTGDLNVAVVEWIVQFRIKDPRKYLFDVRDVPETFRVHVRGRHAPGRRRPQRRRGPHHRPRGDRPSGQGRAAAPLRLLRHRHRGPAARPPGREPSRRREARLQRGEPGHPGEGARHQRRVGRLQQGRPQGQGRGRAGGARGRGVQARAREQRGGRRQPLRRRVRGIQEGPGGHAEADLPRDDARPDAEARPEAHPRRQGQGGPAPAAVRRRRTKEVQP